MCQNEEEVSIEMQLDAIWGSIEMLPGVNRNPTFPLFCVHSQLPVPNSLLMEWLNTYQLGGRGHFVLHLHDLGKFSASFFSWLPGNCTLPAFPACYPSCRAVEKTLVYTTLHIHSEGTTCTFSLARQYLLTCLACATLT